MTTEARVNTANRIYPYFCRIQSFVLLLFALFCILFYCIFGIFIFIFFFFSSRITFFPWNSVNYVFFPNSMKFSVFRIAENWGLYFIYKLYMIDRAFNYKVTSLLMHIVLLEISLDTVAYCTFILCLLLLHNCSSCSSRGCLLYLLQLGPCSDWIQYMYIILSDWKLKKITTCAIWTRYILRNQVWLKISYFWSNFVCSKWSLNYNLNLITICIKVNFTNMHRFLQYTF